MKKIIFGFLIVLFMAAVGYCQESKQPLQLTIKSNKGVWLTIKNFSPLRQNSDDLIGPSKIIFDGKEYSRKQSRAWSGHRMIYPNESSDDFPLVLSDYGITKDMATPGKHSLAVGIGSVVSNTMNIAIVESQLLELTIKPEKQVYQVGENIALMLILKNLNFVTLNIFQLMDSSKIILDGKEYRSTGRPNGWGGPLEIEPGSEINVSLGLLYDVAEDALTIGNHNMAVKINKTISNTVTIEVKGTKEFGK